MTVKDSPKTPENYSPIIKQKITDSGEKLSIPQFNIKPAPSIIIEDAKNDDIELANQNLSKDKEQMSEIELRMMYFMTPKSTVKHNIKESKVCSEFED